MLRGDSHSNRIRHTESGVDPALSGLGVGESTREKGFAVCEKCSWWRGLVEPVREQREMVWDSTGSEKPASSLVCVWAREKGCVSLVPVLPA